MIIDVTHLWSLAHKDPLPIRWKIYVLGTRNTGLSFPGKDDWSRWKPRDTGSWKCSRIRDDNAWSPDFPAAYNSIQQRYSHGHILRSFVRNFAVKLIIQNTAFCRPAYVMSLARLNSPQGSSQGDCDVFYCDSAASRLPFSSTKFLELDGVSLHLDTQRHKDPSCECLLVGFRNCSSTNR